MKKAKIVSILSILVILSFSAINAQTIYTWTDSDGTQRFSDVAPPEGTENVKTITPQETTTPDASNHTTDRPAYDQMVDRAKYDAEQMRLQREQEDAERARKKEQTAKAQLQARINAERQKLLDEIDAISARGLSPTFSQGMKNNLINQVQEKITQLESAPEEYFNSH
jgi:hypothetical protein